MPHRRTDLSSDLDAVRREVAELRAALDVLPLAVAVKDRDGGFLYVNAAASAGYGLSPAAMIGQRESDVLPPGNDAADLCAKDRDVIDGGRSLTVPGVPFRTTDGRRLVLHMTRDPVLFAGAPAVMVTAMDVTELSSVAAERRGIERRMAEAQRLEGLGLMAGGIAHDFNNLLLGVLANADLALREIDAGSKEAVFLERIKSAGDRLASLSRQMLVYSGRGPVDIEALDVAALTQEMLELLRATVPSHVALVTELPGNLPPVAGDRAQLSQVVMNLVTNASEAIGDNVGTIRIAARREFLDSARTASLSVRSLHGATDYLCLEVIDDGAGMDEETRNRIFDPFFTTKRLPGRGLGLASVIGIVRAHRGGLRVDSAPGEGTRMRVWLPLAEERARAAQSLAPVERRLGPSRSVLVVDDEPVVRTVLGTVLRARGFSVEAAESGDAAIDALQRLGAVDAVVLDMTMPGRSVDDTHRALRALVADVPILLVSGYAEPRLLEVLLREPGTQFMQKPFEGSALVSRLRSMLA